ncbi:dihydrodipicolinate synthase family protein [Virgibacillus ndiopensis]|uniref:dihydrodipicolinate synthase family protein n=1 Tax=Virgibacillus ndiopensis TaxID=2004408 RepID=UPI000C06AD4C|nr:dihydrodipicolinate synthase family protein [Virgibacillus ndiopensis]
MEHRYLEGIIPAFVTPLDPSGMKVDRKGIKNLVEFLIEKGVDGLFPLGSTGEGILFDLDTRKQIMSFITEEVNGRIPIVFHAGAHRQQDVLELARFAVNLRADGIAVIPPFYYSLDDNALDQFFSKVAEAVDCPIYLYNIPSNTKNKISTSLFNKLTDKYPHIVGIKDSCMDFNNFYDLTQVAESNQVILMGNDAQILPALTVGGSGSVSAGAVAVPEPYVALYQAYKKGDLDEARKWQAVCAEVKKMLLKSYPVGSHKKALELRGIINGTVSPPLRQMTDQETVELKSRMVELGYLNPVEATK